MRLSALDIRKHEFARGFRGYDQDEVDAFLHMLAQQWQELADENRRLQDRLEEQAGKLSHYMKVEEALEEALETAREGARTRLENADRQAEATTTSAERKAEAAVAEAEAKATALLGEAELRSSSIVHAAEDERRAARHDVTQIAMRRVELIARLRSFLSTELEVLARYEASEAKSDAGFESQMPTVVPAEAPVPLAIVTSEASEEIDLQDVQMEVQRGEEDSSSSDEQSLPAASDIEGEGPAEEENLSFEAEADASIENASTMPTEGKQGELMDDGNGDTTDEIKKIRRILEDLDS